MSLSRDEVRRLSTLSEREAGRKYGKCVPASGSNADIGKSDVIGLGPYEGLRGENKWTQHESYTLKLELLEKILSEAIQEQQTGFFRIDFNGRKFVVVDENFFLQIARFEGE